jgi:RNA polymerase sigma-70 factor (ECF subfamily)
MDTSPPPELAKAREQFLALVESVRPDLHRYTSRLVGSTIDGEDIVQETLAKAFYTLSLQSDLPPLRPWLFRVAHNAAIDFLRRHERRVVEWLPE